MPCVSLLGSILAVGPAGVHKGNASLREWLWLCHLIPEPKEISACVGTFRGPHQWLLCHGKQLLWEQTHIRCARDPPVSGWPLTVMVKAGTILAAPPSFHILCVSPGPQKGNTRCHCKSPQQSSRMPHGSSHPILTPTWTDGPMDRFLDLSSFLLSVDHLYFLKGIIF